MSNLSAFSPRALSILRIVAGLLFLAHGTTKFFAFPAPFGMPLTTPFMIGGVVELVAGTLITVGLFTRLAAFVASGDMAVGYFMIHAPKSFWPSVNMGDAAILYCFVFFYLIFAGPGSWALDHVIGRGRAHRGPHKVRIE